MNEYLFLIIIVTNLKCQITQQSRIDNNLENSDLETSDLKTSDLENSDLENSDLETSDPLENDWNCKRSST